jgi:hypothetical protein
LKYVDIVDKEEIIIIIKIKKCLLLYNMLVAHANDKCAMCGKAVIRDLHDKKKEKEQHQNSSTNMIIVEQIDGTSCYTFDTTGDCVLMFKKFRSV